MEMTPRSRRSNSCFARSSRKRAKQHSPEDDVYRNGTPKGYDSLLRTTTRVLEWMSGDVHLKRLVNLVVEGVYDLVPCERVTLYFADNSKKELWIAVARDAELKGLRIPFGTGIAGQVAITGKLFKSDNCYNDKQFNKSVDIQTGFHTKNMVCIPICSYKTGETLGVFSAINRLELTPLGAGVSPLSRNKVYFQDTDCRLLTIFALQISVALRKCTLQLALQKMAIDNELQNQHDLQLMSAQAELLHTFAQQFNTDADPSISPLKVKIRTMRSSGFVPGRPELKSWPSALPKSANLRGRIMKWDLDVLSLTDKEIRHYAEFILLDMCYPNDNEVVKSRIKPFIIAVADGYHEENPFHNLRHAFSVMHITYMQLKMTAEQLPETLTPMHAFGMLIAAFCHDLDHPGVNDVFLVNSNHPVSWGGSLGDGLLERHHCRKTFEILSVEKSNVIGHLKGSQHKRMRKVIIEAIMSTDMAKHMKYVKRATDLVNDWRGANDDSRARSPHMDNPNPAVGSPNDAPEQLIGPFHPACDELESNRQLLIDIMVHCADLSGQALPWHLALKWGKCVNMEFHQQWVQENKLGLPQTSFMKGLDSVTAQCKGQLYFINAIIVPLWEMAAKLLPGLAHMHQNTKDNIGQYEKLLKQEELKLKAASSTC